MVSRLGGQALYDDVLDITWLADGNLATSNDFGVAGIGPYGRMNWYTAHAWIDAMNDSNYLGLNNWRLPTISPINGKTFNTMRSNDGTTAVGSATIGVGWRDSNNNPASEMGHLLYVNLVELRVCKQGGSNLSCKTQGKIGPTEFVTGLFTNLLRAEYMTGTEYRPPNSNHIGLWDIHFGPGTQGRSIRTHPMWALVVRDGDVGAANVPEPPMLLLLGAAFIGLVRSKRRRT